MFSYIPAFTTYNLEASSSVSFLLLRLPNTHPSIRFKQLTPSDHTYAHTRMHILMDTAHALFTHFRTQKILPILNHLYELSVEKELKELQNVAVKISIHLITLGQRLAILSHAPVFPFMPAWSWGISLSTFTLILHWILDEETADTISSSKLSILERIKVNSKEDRIVLVYMIRFWYFFNRIKNVLSHDGWIMVSYWVPCRLLYAKGKTTTLSKY